MSLSFSHGTPATGNYPRDLTLSGDNDMTVTAILSGKGNDVFTIKPEATLADAAKILVDRRIGALVVVGVDNRVEGIINERNIVRAFAERGVKALSASVAEVMTLNVVTCGLADTVSRDHGADDRQQVPPFAGGRARPTRRYRVDWRRGEVASKRSEARVSSDARIYTHGVILF